MTTKERKVRDEHRYGHMPTVWAAVWSTISEMLKNELSARQLDMVLQAMDCSFRAGVRDAERKAVLDGCVWDEESQRLIDLVQ